VHRVAARLQELAARGASHRRREHGHV
jgi:hypothetical protein